MRNIRLKAIKRCAAAKPGEEFMANSVEAKALVALGFAKRLDAPAYSQAIPVLQSSPPPVHASVVTPVAQVVQIATPPDGVLISKAVFELAQGAGVDVAAIKGNGKDGRVTRGDVEAVIAATKAPGQE